MKLNKTSTIDEISHLSIFKKFQPMIKITGKKILYSSPVHYLFCEKFEFINEMAGDDWYSQINALEPKDLFYLINNEIPPLKNEVLKESLFYISSHCTISTTYSFTQCVQKIAEYAIKVEKKNIEDAFKFIHLPDFNVTENSNEIHFQNYYLAMLYQILHP